MIKRHRHNGRYKSQTPKGNSVLKRRPVHKHNRISKKKRKIFSGMANQPFEVGGQLDFEKGDLENAKIHFGNASELEFEWDPDYESSWHTHPNIKNSTVIPSFEDLLSMRETNEKEQIIFFKNVALSISEHDKFRKISSKKIRKFSDMMQDDFDDGMPDKAIYNKYQPIFRKELGLELKWHGPKKEIVLHLGSV